MIPHKTFFNWSTGKDSALALYYLLQDPAYEVEAMLTTLNAHHDRVTMHGLRRSLWQAQVAALGIPCHTVELPEMPDMATYEKSMEEALDPLLAAGHTHAAFGDIFLEDLKAYREEKLAATGLKAVFPLWKRDTAELAQEFFNLGFEAVVVTVNGQVLDESFAGRVYNAEFVADLPEGVDPCGENGEFHTFCYAGPIYSSPIAYTLGEKVAREYPAPKTDDGQQGPPVVYYYQDLLPV